METRASGDLVSTTLAHRPGVSSPGEPLRFYYTREPGDEGQLLTEDGDPPGTPLSTLLLAHGPMSHRAVLELVSYLADILTISEEDRAIHGAITPNGVFIDEQGAVSIGGWEPRPRPTRAPEGRAVGPATDIFGIGEVMLSAMTGRPLAEAPPNDRAVYDDFIVARLGEVDWAAMGNRKWVGEVRHFLCAMLAHGPDERPEALDIANVLGGVSAVAPGDDLPVWSMLALSAELPEDDGYRDHSESDDYDAPAEPAAFEEDLGGPQMLGGSGVNKNAANRLRKAASAKGESTAFWSRDKIAALLDDDDEDDDDGPVRQSFQVPNRPPAPPSAPAKPPFVSHEPNNDIFQEPTRRNPPPVPPPTPEAAPAARPPAPPAPQHVAPADPPSPPTVPVAAAEPPAPPPTPAHASPVASAPQPVTRSSRRLRHHRRSPRSHRSHPSRSSSSSLRSPAARDPSAA